MHVAPDELMAYFDGELSSERAARIEQVLGRDPEASALLTEWTRVGGVVRGWAERVSEARGAAADEIMCQLQSQRAARTVVPLPVGAGSGRSVSKTARAPARLAWWQATSAAVAVAAAAFLVVRAAGFDSHLAPTTDTPKSREWLGLSGRDGQPGAEEQPGAAIETLDLGEHQGTIFLVSAGSEVTPVVWVQDDFPSQDHGREKTL